MKQKRSRRPPGQIRQSQVVTTFGPGAMLDLPNHSVLVAGLDYWSAGGDEIHEPRLIEKLKRLLASCVAGVVADELQQMVDLGLTTHQLAVVLELVAKDRSHRPALEDVIDLVTTGPEAPGVTNRDTSVVVRELFAHADRSVLVAGYAVYQGQHVFRALADRMQEWQCAFTTHSGYFATCRGLGRRSPTKNESCHPPRRRIDRRRGAPSLARNRQKAISLLTPPLKQTTAWRVMYRHACRTHLKWRRRRCRPRSLN